MNYGRKKILLYFCPEITGCGKLQSCTKHERKHPGRQCKRNFCKDYFKCEIRKQYATYEKFSELARKNPRILQQFGVEFALCNRCRGRKKEIKKEAKIDYCPAGRFL